MKRREFCKSSMLAAGLALGGARLPAAESPAGESPNAPGLTRYVSEFIVNTRYEDIPQGVLALGKKSILDGFGLALAGSVSTLAPLLNASVVRRLSLPHPARLQLRGATQHSVSRWRM
jgi:hypothetical protein